MKTTDRRTVLKGAAATAAGLTLTTGPAAQPQTPTSNRPPLRIGLMTYNLGRDWDIETLIKNCTEAKFEHIELRTTHAHKVEVNLTPKQRAEVKKRFADSAIRAISLASGFSYHHADPDRLRANIEGTKAYTLLAHDIGALGIRVFANQWPVPGVAPERTLEQIARACREVALFAADHGVQIRLANHGHGTNRLKITRRILDLADCPALAVNFNCDPTDVEAPGFEHNYGLVRGRIGNIHLHQLYNEQYPYRRLFELLRADGYQGYCDAEIPASPEPVRLMKYYRALFLAYQNVI